MHCVDLKTQHICAESNHALKNSHFSFLYRGQEVAAQMRLGSVKLNDSTTAREATLPANKQHHCPFASQ